MGEKPGLMWNGQTGKGGDFDDVKKVRWKK